MTVVDKAKHHPLTAAAVLIGAVAGAGTAVWAGVGLIDTLHTTETELLLYDLKAHTFASEQFAGVSTQFSGLEDALMESAVLGKCRWLKSEIRALEDTLYVRRRDKADADFINALEQDLEDLEDDYEALLCALKLA